MSEVTASAGAERAAGGGAELSADQAHSLYRDGFVVLKDLIPKETWSAARRQLMMRLGAVQQAASGYSPARAANLVGGGQAEAVAAQKATGSLPEVTELFEPIRPILEHALGSPLERAAGGQMALNFPTEAGEGINETGWKDAETPFFGWGGHVDGVWNGGTQIPQSREATDEEKWCECSRVAAALLYLSPTCLNRQRPEHQRRHPVLPRRPRPRRRRLPLQLHRPHRRAAERHVRRGLGERRRATRLLPRHGGLLAQANGAWRAAGAVGAGLAARVHEREEWPRAVPLPAGGAPGCGRARGLRDHRRRP